MFNQRLRSTRMKRKYTQQNMADLLGISLNAYQKYEQGTRTPPIDMLVLIANVFDVSLDFLLGRDDFLKSLGVSADEYL